MLASLFVHVTVDPTEILIAVGLNPLLLIEALTLIALGEVGALLPHAVAATKNSTANASLRKYMISSFPGCHGCKRTAHENARKLADCGEELTAGLRRTESRE